MASPKAPLPRAPLPRAAYGGPVLGVARALLGCFVVSDSAEGPVVMRITEVEAYAGADDAASHAHRRQTARNAPMFGPPGHAYVYFTYGMHWCLNVVAEAAGTPAAVLVRAGQVVDGVELARIRRTPGRDRDLARGPARLAQALGVTGALNGADLTIADAALRVHPGPPVDDREVSHGPRVGIRSAVDLPWRLWLTDDPTVSTFRPAKGSGQ
ncbi:MAG TPA: DNA-3-methyladenine glycosylase [Mycobacteriales bacterium]|nr:DNA-3-methyladenine glycosylase [Mycobacteriales bacterium]